MENDATAVPASEARVHMGEMLRRVRKGEHIIIEKGGLPAAALIDVHDYEEYRRLKEAQERTAGPPAILSSPTPDGLERLKRAAGSWKDMDPDEFMRRVRESRKISTRPPVSLP
jgi:prevent-host-death family protein